MISPLRWTTKSTIFVFHYSGGAKSQDSVHKPQLLKRKENPSRGIESTSSSCPTTNALPPGPDRLTTHDLTYYLVCQRACFSFLSLQTSHCLSIRDGLLPPIGRIRGGSKVVKRKVQITPRIMITPIGGLRKGYTPRSFSAECNGFFFPSCDLSA